MSFERWSCGRFTLDLSKTAIMGVLNCTPDSFSDGGAFVSADQAVARAEQMIAEGADIIDIGAESTRPGAQAVSAEEEIRRLTPIVQPLVAMGGVPISIDTRHGLTMRAMLDLGVDMINDVHALEEEGALAAVMGQDCAICLMHMRGVPQTMQNNTDYEDVVAEVDRYLQERAAVCLASGISPERLVLDPGFGFGKTPAQNMALIRYGKKFADGKFPVLIGVSRKSSIGHYLGDRPVDDRLIGSVTLAALGVWQGANIVRVHDVAQTHDALAMVNALRGE